MKTGLFPSAPPGSKPSAVLIAVFQPLTTHESYPCEVTSLPIDLRPRGNGLIFRKNWPYTQLFNYHLLKMHEEGIVNQLRKSWVRARDASTCSAEAGRRPQAGLEHVVSLFMLWAVGLGIAGAVWMAEFVYRKCLNASEAIDHQDDKEKGSDGESNDSLDAVVVVAANKEDRERYILALKKAEEEVRKSKSPSPSSAPNTLMDQKE